MSVLLGGDLEGERDSSQGLAFLCSITENGRSHYISGNLTGARRGFPISRFFPLDTEHCPLTFWSPFPNGSQSESHLFEPLWCRMMGNVGHSVSCYVKFKTRSCHGKHTDTSYLVLYRKSYSKMDYCKIIINTSIAWFDYNISPAVCYEAS